MNLIVAVDKNWAIGYNNDLLVSIPADKKFFRMETIGKAIIMGRKTLESFPNGQPLKDRKNIVITRKKDYNAIDVTVVHSIEVALEAVKDFKSEDVYVIGGGEIYKQMLPYCDVAHVTYIEQAYAADSYFPNLDKDPEWTLVAESDEQTYFDITYYFRKYERIKK